LESYKPFINDFFRYSGEIFDFDDHVFKQKFKSESEVRALQMRRSTENEYKLTEKHIRMSEGNGANLSPSRIERILKKLPPFSTDVIDLDDIESFQQKGTLGWTFLAN
jgi:hypothetical protein